MGVPVERTDEELAAVEDDITRAGRRDAYYARTKLKPARDLREQADDGARLWALTEQLFQPWRSAG